MQDYDVWKRRQDELNEEKSTDSSYQLMPRRRKPVGGHTQKKTTAAQSIALSKSPSKAMTVAVVEPAPVERRLFEEDESEPVPEPTATTDKQSPVEVDDVEAKLPNAPARNHSEQKTDTTTSPNLQNHRTRKGSLRMISSKFRAWRSGIIMNYFHVSTVHDWWRNYRYP